MQEFFGKVGIFMGATSGIGLEAAQHFVKKGGLAIACGLGAKNLEALNAEYGQQLRRRELDVTDVAQLQALARELESENLTVDVLVNAAGVMVFGSATDTSLADWEKCISVNMTGTFLSSQTFIPLMKRGGAIVNISSVVALAAGKRRLPYAAAKAGVIGITKAMAVDHAAAGIRVNAVAPGAIETPMLHHAWKSIAPQKSHEEMRNALIDATPLGLVGKPSHVAELILFLCGDSSKFITGTVIPVDGGVTAQLAVSQAR